MAIPRILKTIAQAPYYRRHWLDALREVGASVQFKRHRLHEPSAFLASLGIDPDEALDGFDRWRPMLEEVRDRVAAASSDPESAGDHGGCSLEDGTILYGVARILRPRIVVETGVAAGVSTSFIGAALIENGFGTLYSVELPPAEVVNGVQEDGSSYAWSTGGVGWAIPRAVHDGLRGRHHLILEDVRTALPRLVADLPEIDLYFHDDLHTPDHMLWQFRLVWPRIAPGGALLSDDSNIGWLDFCSHAGIGKKRFTNMQRLTAALKPTPVTARG